jgi:predicted N-acetyltransferase YhbS
MHIVDLTGEHLTFVTLCTREYEPSDEGDRVIAVRRSWLERMAARGLKVKVVIDDGQPVGFVHCLPLELGVTGMSWADLMAIPCLAVKYQSVYRRKTSSGYGRALMEATESEARTSSKGVAVVAHDDDFWFMPAGFFRRLGYREVARRADTVVMLKSFDPVEPPAIHHLSYHPRLIRRKVTVDVF